MKIGIFFGGPSREREISFAGGRTVYDNLDKSLFEAVPIFVDSQGQFVLLDWQYIYKGTIRDFYPPVSALPPSPHQFQVYAESLPDDPARREAALRAVGTPLSPSEFKQHFDFAFLTLHGPHGEDGSLQGLLEWYGIPYSGAGILSSAVGVNKVAQKELMRAAGFRVPEYRVLDRTQWLTGADRAALLRELTAELGLPLVIKSPNQGSSIGVSVVRTADAAAFGEAVERSLFVQRLARADWQQRTDAQRVTYVRTLTDLREGIGLPVWVADAQGQPLELIRHPEALLDYLNTRFDLPTLTLLSPEGEEQVLVEAFIRGKEFSCIVVEDEDGQPIALPPTEIVKGGEVFDYRAKYLPGMVRKVTPIDLPEAQINAIRMRCEMLFEKLQFNVYARLDGFITPEGEVFLNDPNTTSGMLPSSFFFHQAAEIGLNPSQFLSYIIRTSLAARVRSGKGLIATRRLLTQLDAQLMALKSSASARTRVAVIMGGFSSERHISVESGRNIYEKLASSVKYEPFPVFLTGSPDAHALYLLPINSMLKDNADDIRAKVEDQGEGHPVLRQIQYAARRLTDKYAAQPLTHARRIGYETLAELADTVFIALHGRPGEDGAVQAHLERLGLPYNGSGIASSQITINKYETNEILRQAGVRVADHYLLGRAAWEADPETTLTYLEGRFAYPFIAKPADDGCSSAVKKIKNREELTAFVRMMFRAEPPLLTAEAEVLHLRLQEEFPRKDHVLIEALIGPEGADHFLEITGGLLTRYEDGRRIYEVFEPSETLAAGEVLSLEEKFLAGEGQNITPARFAPQDPAAQAAISAQVRAELQRVAELLDVEGYARIDAFVRIFDEPTGPQAETIVIEINSLPGMTPATCIFHQTALNGYKPYHFIDAILTYGAARQGVRA